ncbi:TrpR-binding protein WrbA [Streptomyces spiroverticillatus]|uniref:TrpR-binding protein WrbA n=1 Tax=Streptomyces finlayi TaxID=67296 RepID=A0A919C8U9_9ACTN|nr:NAD(P)H:quinone oxidoreductase [Streptomyces finlayi]GHA00234.1 TrpR-binding protein WrbA [Streptomyces spiroverticillatus]GHC84724.1 TrpR-binding protein WrbA [Streptomyces finlayi]
MTTTAAPAKIAVVYYSATGSVHALAAALAEGAAKTGAEVRLLRVAELAPDAALDANPAWRAHADATRDVPVATLDDLRWADAYAFGTPTRYGNVSSQLKQFLDSTGGLWASGVFTDKPVTGFVSTSNPHGGNESTLLALYNTMYHWGTLIVPPGFTSPVVSAAGGNPYGTTFVSGGDMGAETLDAARYQGERLATLTSRLLVGAQAKESAG